MDFVPLQRFIRGRYRASGLLVFQFLPFKLWQSGSGLAPRLGAIHEAHNSLDNLVLPGSHLRRSVAVTEGNSPVLYRLEVDRDAQRRAQLVVTRIALAWESLDQFEVSRSGVILPIETLESSTLVDSPWLRRTLVSFAISGLKEGFEDSGTKRTLVGATAGGNERT
jgi:hypothetical protein